MTGMVLPTPAFDHVIVNARDQLAAAAEAYRRLGFTLTPLGRHSLGSINHLAIFATDYLELVGVEPDSAGPVRSDILGFPPGLNGLVFATEDAAQIHRLLTAAGLVPETPVELSRPVTLAEGSGDARFRVTRLPAAAVPYGRVYFCQHATRSLVWRDEWRQHPNGVVALARAVLCTADPAAAAGLYRRMFGPATVRAIDGGFSLTAGLAGLDIVTPRRLAGWFGAAAPTDAGRRDYLAALTFRTRSLETCGQALRQGGIAEVAQGDGRIIVDAAAGFGAALEFIE